MKLGIVGKSNTGKSTFFKASTLVDVEISNRIFTTIKPNTGIGYVTSPCPCKELNLKCNPQNSRCVDGIRLIPVELTDVAGLVPDAHKGRGLGNQFLSDVMEASALIHIVDISGSTDSDGNPVPSGTHDPSDDVKMLEKEINYWILGLLKKDRQITIDTISKRLSGLGIERDYIEEIGKDIDLRKATDDQLLSFVTTLRKKAKPLVIAANKIDTATAEKNLETMRSQFPDYMIIPCSAEVELALREAGKEGLVKYVPGEGSFEVIDESRLDEKQKKGLSFIRNFLSVHKSTGVQPILDIVIFDVLDMIVAYPVENEKRYSDKKGNVLPDAILLKKGSTPVDLAYKIHEDIGKKFIAAVDARTEKNIGSEYEIKNGDIISIKSGK